MGSVSSPSFPGYPDYACPPAAAALFTTLTWVTGNPVYDAIGSMGVGAVMGGIAMMLIRNNKQFLIGRRAASLQSAAS